MTPDHFEDPQREAYLANQRWFAGKGRAFSITGVRVLDVLEDRLRFELVEVSYAEGEPGHETYQMPVTAYHEPQEHLGHALVREGDGEWTYDALHDREAMDLVLQAFTGERTGPVSFRRVGEHVLEPDARSAFFSGEQSNSSVIFGEDAILKVYRKLHQGANPDIELHRALTEAGSTDIAHLYGWISDGDHDLAMLQQFLRTASDGWELALASARNLFTEGDLHADEVGGDFAAEAHRLGATLAEVHTVLAEAFGTTSVTAAETVATMAARLSAARAVVPELEDLAPGLTERFAALGDLGTLTVQRVHGDLHLGQTLRTSLGWKLVDFEGEPAKDLAERQLPDSPWRDVAGMIRSFDYAAASVSRDLGTSSDEAPQLAYRAGEWTAHNTGAFLTGYAEQRGAPITEDEQVLLDAYITDKAVYEATYEARSRPGWLPIPLAALARLGEPTR